MFYKIILTLQAILIFNCLFSQNNIIEGQVFDSNRNPLPFVNIYLKQSNIGVITNRNGQFKVNISDIYKKDSLIVSFIGYKTQVYGLNQIKSNYLKINLLENIEIIAEISISAKQDWKKYVKNAIEKISDNYIQKEMQFTAFYREILLNNSQAVRLSESVNTIYYQAYNASINEDKSLAKYLSYYQKFHDGFAIRRIDLFNPILHQDDKLFVIESRSSEDYRKTTANLLINGGPMALFTFDEVKLQNKVLNKNLLRKYNFSLDTVTSLNNKLVYVISFIPKRKKEVFQGKLYIQNEDLAFIRIDFSFSEKNTKLKQEEIIYSLESNTKLIKDKFSDKALDISVRYKKKNNKYYINTVYIDQDHYYNDITQNKEFDVSTRSIIHVSEINTSFIKTDTVGTPFDYQYWSALSYLPTSYNKGFWGNYNGIPLDSVTNCLISSLDSIKNITKQFGERFEIDTNLCPPCALPQIDSITNDNFSWLMDINNPKTKEYIQKENEYTDNFSIPFNSNINQIASQLFKSLPVENKDSTKVKKQLYKVSKNDDKIIYKDSITIFDITPFYEHKLVAIEEFLFNKDSSQIAIKVVSKFNSTIWVKNLDNNRLIKPVEEQSTDFFWFNNNLIYSISNDGFNVTKVFEYNTKQDSSYLLAKAGKGESLEIKLTNSKQYLIIYQYKVYGMGLVMIKDTLNNLYSFDYTKFKINTKFEHIKGEHFFILSDYKRIDGSIFTCDINNLDPRKWNRLYKDRIDGHIKAWFFKVGFIVLKVKKDMKTSILIFNNRSGERDVIKFGEFSEISLIKSKEQQLIYYDISSPINPRKTYSYNLLNKKIELINVVNYNDYKPNSFQIKRVYSQSKNSKQKIPITLFYSINLINKNTHPLYIETYGSYGAGQNLNFRPELIPLLKKGFIVAYAHVRGGDDLGSRWYFDGKGVNKQNSIDDFIQCTKHLIKKGYTSKDKIVAFGRSAGGIVMGGAANNRPDLYKMIILENPFLDIISGIKSDPFEIPEFGDIKANLPIVEAYSPYENIKKQDYPYMLYLSGLYDVNVFYWDPLKSIAKLRYINKGNTKQVFIQTYKGDHNGSFGLNSNIYDTAYKYAFIYNILGIE